MTAKSALEMMLPQLMRAMGLDPDKTRETIEGVGNAVVEIRDRLARIEAKLDIAIGAEHGAELDLTGRSADGLRDSGTSPTGPT
jgi:hypothetical protein